MEVLEKKEQLNQLYDLYKNLLTEKQVLYYELYYHEDYSLQEIAEINQVSRNAVYDHLKKVEDHLYDYEDKLKLLYKQTMRLSIYDELESKKDVKLVEQLRKLDE
ncbi:MAG: DNA-binding protein [Acholeplasmataceae bacterium]|jgi:predicted DNA-binding protein YlxM (UPF0122 family)|nr:DNA-binding protein [Acholeplasmataceae bacterium]